MSYSEAVLDPFTILPDYRPREMLIRPSTQKKRVLIVDDDKEITNLVREVLTDQSKIEVTVANDPFEAMYHLTDSLFDLVILDWHLPKLNGLKTILEAEKLFNQEHVMPFEWYMKKVPVVTFSSDESASCRFMNTRHFKYVGHIHKKNTFALILDKINYHLDRA